MMLAFSLLQAAVGVAPLWASDRAALEGEALATRAKAMFRAGQFAEAAELYLLAYARTRRPLMLYNAARATEQAGNAVEARALFLEYVRLDGVGNGERQEAQARADALASKAAPAKTNPAQTNPAQTNPAKPAASTAPPADPSPVRDPASDPTSDPTREPSRNPTRESDPAEKSALRRTAPVRSGEVSERPPRTWPIVGASVFGLAAVGAWFYASNQAHNANLMNVNDYFSKQAYLTQADSARTWQLTAIGLGAAASGMAIWAVAVGGSKAAPAKLVLIPDFSGATLVATW